MSAFEAQVDSVARDPVARAYAVVLALLHVLTAVAWVDYKNVIPLLSADDCVCWPFFPDCHRLRPFLSASLVRSLVYTYAGLGLVSARLFWTRRIESGAAAFVAATVLGAAIYVLDYRLRFNQTTMFGWVVVTVLVLDKRRLEALQLLIALFYVWAGTLKLDPEWMSGMALYGSPLFLPHAWLPAASVYVVALELVLIWGLFARDIRWRWAVYLQLLVFHLVSFGVVRWFYPLLMFGLTAIYPLVWKLAPERALTFARLRQALSPGQTRSSDPSESWRSMWAVAGAFSAFQLVPYLYPGDSAVTGEGRLFALHMFDARMQCAGEATLTYPDGRRARALLINDALDVRTRCDPIVLFGTAKRICRAAALRGETVRVDVAIDARRATDRTMKPLIRVEDLCRESVDYSLLRHNEWIKVD